MLTTMDKLFSLVLNRFCGFKKEKGHLSKAKGIVIVERGTLKKKPFSK